MDPFGENLRLALSPGGKRLASLGSDSTIRRWNLENAPVTSVSIPNNGGFARILAFSNDGQLVISANEEWTVRWWNIADEELLIPPVRTRLLRIDNVVFSHDGRWIATGDFDDLIEI